MSKRALVTILVGLSLLLIAATIRSGWLYLVSSFLFALVIAGVLGGWFSTRKVSLDRKAPAEVFEGEPFAVRLTVSNEGRAARRLLSVKDVQFRGKGRGVTATVRDRRSEFKEYMRTGKAPPVRKAKSGGIRTVTIEELPGGGEVAAAYELTAPRRGVFDGTELILSGGGVFGTAQVKRKVSADGALTVFPRVTNLESFIFEPHASMAPVEAIEWSRKGIGQDYYGTREYAQGDSLRHIHWRSSARQAKLIVKEYEQELKPSVALVIALWAPSRGDEDNNSMEDGLRAAASIISFHESIGGLPLLVLPEPRTTRFRVTQPQTLYSCYEELAAYAPPRGGRFSEGVANAVQRAFEAMVPGSALVLVTNAPPDRVTAALDYFETLPSGAAVLAIDDSYGPHWRDEWLDEAPWLAGFTGMDMSVYAVTGSREMGRCLDEPLSTTD